MFKLTEELKTYQPFNEDENKNLLDTINFLQTCHNGFSRENLSGHVTAGGLVVNSCGMILLNHHFKTGMWFQFGGHCDGVENCLDVAKREIKEEAGIDNLELISGKIFDVNVVKINGSEKRSEPEHFHYDINFLFYSH